MKFLDLTLPSPAENLACEEALLDACEESRGGEVLRFWESVDTFVVIGYANKVGSEVDLPACVSNVVPILRRCSGGGAVVQGAGCLNYALILQITEDGPLRNITSANQFIMERNRVAIESLYKTFNIQHSTFNFSVSGHTDLAIAGRKFSGNSQRRKKNALLFHGTMLLNFDLALVSEFLRMPSLQPGYRAGRSHDDFLMNLNLPSDQVKSALKKAWGATEEFTGFPKERIQILAEQKYSTDEWNLKL